MSELVYLGLMALGGYLLGSIPFGVLSTRLAGIDIRDVGSGNIGATNVLRTGRKDLAALTFLGDTGKGALAVGLAFVVMQDHPLDLRQSCMALAGFFAFLGHLFPVWLQFRGGKGVATFVGTLLAASWPMGLIVAVLWLLSAFLTRISSLSALSAAALIAPLGFFIDQPFAFVVMALAMAVLIFVRHKDNIARLLAGTEPRIGQKNVPAPDLSPDQEA